MARTLLKPHTFTQQLHQVVTREGEEVQSPQDLAAFVARHSGVASVAEHYDFSEAEVTALL